MIPNFSGSSFESSRPIRRFGSFPDLQNLQESSSVDAFASAVDPLEDLRFETLSLSPSSSSEQLYHPSQPLYPHRQQHPQPPYQHNAHSQHPQQQLRPNSFPSPPPQERRVASYSDLYTNPYGAQRRVSSFNSLQDLDENVKLQDSEQVAWVQAPDNDFQQGQRRVSSVPSLTQLESEHSMPRVASFSALTPDRKGHFHNPTRSKNTQVCRFWAQGKCTQTDPCPFLHVAPARSPATQPPPTAPPGLDEVVTASGLHLRTLADVSGRLLEVSQDAAGCRFLQRHIQSPEAAALFEEFVEHARDLMVHRTGCQLVNKLLESCEEHQRLLIVEAVAPVLASIAMSPVGKHSVQKLIDTVNSPDQITTVIHSLKPHVCRLVVHQHGSQVLQRFLGRMRPHHNQFIFDSLAGRAHFVASDRHGCCVLKKCLQVGSETQTHQLVDLILAHTLSLAQDPFGNYVIQSILETKVPAYVSSVLEHLRSHVVQCSRQKFSSNVIEKCLALAGPQEFASMCNELFQPEDVQVLLLDRYGNYVLQRAMETAPRQHAKPLVDLVRQHLWTSPYSRRIQGCISRLTALDEHA